MNKEIGELTAEECIEILRARGYAIWISADSNELDLLKGPKNDEGFSMQGERESLMDALRGAVELSGCFDDSFGLGDSGFRMNKPVVTCSFCGEPIEAEENPFGFQQNNNKEKTIALMHLCRCEGDRKVLEMEEMEEWKRHENR